MLLALIPYGAPTNLRLATPEIQKIFVEWDEVDAALKNGMIKGYKIHYKLDGQEEKTKDVKGGGVFQTTLEGDYLQTPGTTFALVLIQVWVMVKEVLTRR